MKGNYFWCDFQAFWLGGALPTPCCGCSLVLGPPQLNGSFRSGLGPCSRGCDRWRHRLETCLWQKETPMLSEAEGSPGCPHKQVPFHANACPESSVSPTRESPSCSSTQQMACPTSFPLIPSHYLLLCSIRGGRDGFTQYLPFSKLNKLL